MNSPGSAGRQPSIAPKSFEYLSDHGVPAMKLKLRHIFAGLAVRTGKPQRQRLIDRLAAYRITHPRQCGLARPWHTADEAFESDTGVRPTDPHNGNRRR